MGCFGLRLCGSDVEAGALENPHELIGTARAREGNIEVDDAASCAGAWLLEEISGRRFGGSSGTNLFASLRIAAGMKASGKHGSIVTLLCDRGERYADTVFDRGWLTQRGLCIDAWLDALRAVKERGVFTEPCNGSGKAASARSGTVKGATRDACA